METHGRQAFTILQNPTSLYREFLAERQEILDHKWIESEKAEHDIGFEGALTDWIVKHKEGWRRRRNYQGILEAIQNHGIKIIVLSGKNVYVLPPLEETHHHISNLQELCGDYILEQQNTLRKSIVPLDRPVLGKIFIREYKEGNHNYRLHIEESLEITVNRSQEGILKIV